MGNNKWISAFDIGYEQSWLWEVTLEGMVHIQVIS